jgi:hypothetical protein
MLGHAELYSVVGLDHKNGNHFGNPQLPFNRVITVETSHRMLNITSKHLNLGMNYVQWYVRAQFKTGCQISGSRHISCFGLGDPTSYNNKHLAKTAAY